jgi:hypothetical protein
VPDIRGSSLHNHHSSGTWNFDVAPRFLENLCTPTFMTDEYCVVENVLAFGKKNMLPAYKLMASLEYFSDIILLVALWPWGQLNL